MLFSLRYLQRLLAQDALKVASLSGILLLSVNVGVLGWAAPTRAAERVILTYGALQEPFSVEDMKTFAATGELSRLRQFQLRVGGADPEVLREFLNQKVQVKFLTLDRSLNSLPGEFLLYQIGQVLHNRQRVAPIQSLRAAMVLSARDDDAVTMLEFLQNYPLPEVFVDGKKILEISRKVGNTRAKVARYLETTKAMVEQVLNRPICACESQSGSRDTIEPTAR
jgi:hypothetical protein